MKRIAMLTTALVLMSTAAHAMNGRAVFTPDQLHELNIEAAEQLELPVLPDTEIQETKIDLGGKYGFARIVNKTNLIQYHAGVKNFHMFHEVVHYYQNEHPEIDLGGEGCRQPREVHAMVQTSAWCERNNCPVHDMEYIGKIQNCK